MTFQLLINSIEIQISFFSADISLDFAVLQVISALQFYMQAYLPLDIFHLTVYSIIMYVYSPVKIQGVLQWQTETKYARQSMPEN